MKLALLHNPQSGYNRRYPDRVPLVAREAGVPLWESTCGADLAPLMHRIAAEKPDVLVINGGDGTVDAVVSCLRQDLPFAEEPMLAVLPGGTTNMIARDVGCSTRPENGLRWLADAQRAGRTPESVKRSPLTVCTQHAGPAVRRGFFLGGGALPRALRDVQSGLHARGLIGQGGEMLALMMTAARLLFGDVRRDPLFSPSQLTWSAERASEPLVQAGETVLYFVTTLDRLVLGIRPTQPEPGLRFLALRFPYHRLLVSLMQLMGGRDFRKLDGNFVFRGGKRLVLTFEGEAVLDGEALALPAGPVCLHIGLDAPCTFLRI